MSHLTVPHQIPASPAAHIGLYRIPDEPSHPDLPQPVYTGAEVEARIADARQFLNVSTRARDYAFKLAQASLAHFIRNDPDHDESRAEYEVSMQRYNRAHDCLRQLEAAVRIG